MNVRLFAALLIALFSLSVMTGCQTLQEAAQATQLPVGAQPSQGEDSARQTAPEKLTPEQAKEIALQHAGLTKDQVTRLKAEYDYDDGRPEYDVEFYYNGWEYDYDIHAQTGKILRSDKEIDD